MIPMSALISAVKILAPLDREIKEALTRHEKGYLDEWEMSERIVMRLARLAKAGILKIQTSPSISQPSQEAL